MTDYYSKYLDLIYSEKNKYRGAGFIFYDNADNKIFFLLGLDNTSKEKQRLGIFGGAKEKKDISPLYTAVRETFEELFNVVPSGLDIFIERIQKKIDDYSIIEKIFVKSNNEVCYIANINILNLFIEHLIYHESPWTFKNKHTWNEYHNKVHMFFNDRILKPNLKVTNGLNEIKKVYLLNWSTISSSINLKEPIIIDKKEYYVKDNLNKYLQDNIIIDIINKKI
jgi:hypothetical protein